MTNVVILGSTGSVGSSTLEATLNLEEIEVYGISVHTSVRKMLSQIEKFQPQIAVITDEDAYRKLDKKSYLNTKILSGSEGLIELVSDDKVDIVVNALTGIAGLNPFITALKAGKRVAAANKEAIVMGWELIKKSVKYVDQIIPVDSEHSAIFQLLRGEEVSKISRIIITASGGAVYNCKDLEKITFSDCLAHPNWDMGDKITIDSALLFNKGLEVIEARNLFDIDYSKIDVFIHPQSIVHGMVEFKDGSIISHLAPPDMKIPIQYALTYPARQKTSVEKLNINSLSRLDFSLPNKKRFPCLDIAVNAGKEGGIKPVLLCAADEVAVDAFFQGKIGFTQIPKLIKKVLEKDITGSMDSVDAIEEIYCSAKSIAEDLI